MKEEKIWKVIQLIEWTSNYFNKHGIDSYRLKAELLLAHLLDCSRLDLYRDFDKPLTKYELTSFKKMLKRVLNREPLQMIIGKVFFVNVELFVDSSTIVPRPETEFLTASIIEDNKGRKNLNFLDIGTGSACIALSIAKSFPDSKITAIDISDKAIALGERNMKHNHITNVTFQRLDVSNERIKEKFDVIVSNPPYIEFNEYEKLEPEVKNWEPENALTDRGDGLSFYRRFAKIFPEILREGGKFYLEIGWGQAEKIKQIFSDDIFSIKISNDANDIPRYVQGEIIQ